MPSPPETSPDTVLAFASRDFLRLVEAQGLVGGWFWTFATQDHVWSSALLRLCGLPPDTRPSYDLLLALVHPEDRPGLESSFDIVECGLLRDHTFRLIRPDGTLRFLSSHGEVFFDVEGPPRSAAACIVDVTERQAIARARSEERRRRWALFQEAGTWMNMATYTPSSRSASEEILALTGLTQSEFRADCLKMLDPGERSRIVATVGARMRRGTAFSVMKRLVLADGGRGDFRFVYAPIRGEADEIQGWATVASRADQAAIEPSGDLRRALELGVKGEHLRAARALLDWSMTDLARACHLSLSTIRRLEENVDGAALRNIHGVVRTLRQAGIGFLVLESGRIAVTKL